MIIPSSIERRTDGRWRVEWPLATTTADIDTTGFSPRMLTFSPDGTRLAGVSDDANSTITVWNASTGAVVSTWSAGYTVIKIAWAKSDGRYLLSIGYSSSNNYYTKWEAASKNNLYQKTYSASVKDVAGSVDAWNYAAVSTFTAPDSSSTEIISLSSNAVIRTINITSTVPAFLALSGGYVFISHVGGAFKYVASTGALAKSFSSNYAYSISAIGSVLAVSLLYNVVNVHETVTDTQLKNLKVPDTSFVQLSPDSRFLFLFKPGQFLIVDTSQFKVSHVDDADGAVWTIASIYGHACATISNNRIAYFADDETIKFIDFAGITDTAQIWQDGRVVAEVDAPTNYYDFLYTETAPEIEIIEKVSTPENYCVSCVASPAIETQWRGTTTADIYELQANINGAGYTTLAEYPEDGRGYYLHDFEAEDEDTISMKVQAIAGQTDAAAPEFSFVVTAPPTRPEVVVSYDSEAGAIIFEEAE